YYEQYTGKKRVTVLKRLLRHLNAIKPKHGIGIQIFGWGREKVAKALECKLDGDGSGSVKINPMDAAKIITDNATNFFVRGGGSVINRVMSAFWDTKQPQEKTIPESGHLPPEHQFIPTETTQIYAELLL
ncbi:MAG: hypothetical protein ACPG8W_00965, partial [Candidatus Promineifilaceae bacterium]